MSLFKQYLENINNDFNSILKKNYKELYPLWLNYLEDELIDNLNLENLDSEIISEAISFFKYKIELKNEIANVDSIEELLDSKYSKQYKNILIYLLIKEKFNNEISVEFSSFSYPLKIYRAIKLTEIQFKKIIENKNGCGIYWTYEKDLAETHWGYDKDGISYVFNAETTKDNIDWNSTYLANLHPTVGSDEKEITMKLKSKVKLISVSKENKEITINKIIMI